MRAGAALFCLFLALWAFGVAGERTVWLGMRGAGAVLFIGQWAAWQRLMDWNRSVPPLETSAREAALTIGAIGATAMVTLGVVAYMVGG